MEGEDALLTLTELYDSMKSLGFDLSYFRYLVNLNNLHHYFNPCSRLSVRPCAVSHISVFHRVKSSGGLISTVSQLGFLHQLGTSDSNSMSLSRDLIQSQSTAMLFFM